MEIHNLRDRTIAFARGYGARDPLIEDMAAGEASGLRAATARWLSRQGRNVSIVNVGKASGRLVTNEGGGLHVKSRRSRRSGSELGS